MRLRLYVIHVGGLGPCFDVLLLSLPNLLSIPLLCVVLVIAGIYCWQVECVFHFRLCMCALMLLRCSDTHLLLVTASLGRLWGKKQGALRLLRIVAPC